MEEGVAEVVAAAAVVEAVVDDDVLACRGTTEFESKMFNAPKDSASGDSTPQLQSSLWSMQHPVPLLQLRMKLPLLTDRSQGTTTSL